MRMQIVTDQRATSTATSFADVYAQHRDRAVRLAYLLCGDPELAQDLAAEAFAKTWRQYDRDAGRIDDVGAYLRRAVVNQRNSWWRRTSMHRDRVERRVTGDARGGLEPDDQIVQHDELWSALSKLSERQRQVLVLRYWEDLSVEQTANALGISSGTVKSLTSRATTRLRDLVPGGALR